MNKTPNSGAYKINKLVVIGLGLLGSSLCAAAKKLGLARQVIGISRRQSTIEIALKKGVIDRSEDSISQLADEFRDGDVIVLAVPILSFPSILLECCKSVPTFVTITDVGSVKGSVIETAESIYGYIPDFFVPGHPIAGSEKSGINALNSKLFEEHKVIITPVEETQSKHINAVKTLWEQLGAEVRLMTPDEHDNVFAATSHLPHYLAYSLVDTLSKEKNADSIFDHAAGGFRDFTRIAASDPTMWHDIAVTNRDAILEIMDRYIHNLNDLRSAVSNKDSSYLIATFNRARDIKKSSKNKMSSLIDYRAKSVTGLRGTIEVPGDKSISHRSIIFGSLANGMSEINGFLEGEDSLATLNAFRDLGVVIEGPQDGRLVIHGVGLYGLSAPKGDIYLGNSGTSMRLMTGLLSAQPFRSRLVGDESLSGRPMRRVTDPLSDMGAVIEITEKGTPPVDISGTNKLTRINYLLPVASAQLKSSLILAAMYARGLSTIEEPVITRDHTERMMSAFGCGITSNVSGCIKIEGGKDYGGTRIDVPGDISSAAFFIVAALICPNSNITICNVGINPTRIGILNILEKMGADIEVINERHDLFEPTADLKVRYSTLKGIKIPKNQISLAIDEFPIIFIAAACASGETILRGAEELRVKESDRIESMAKGLETLGIQTTVYHDGIKIIGGEIGSGTVNSNHDHRIAMAFSIAAIRSSGEVLIEDCKNVATSFPNFIDLAKELGMRIDSEVR